MTNTWLLSPARVLENASHRPSGDHLGEVADLLPRVSCSGSPPVVGTSQIWVTKASSPKSARLTV